jgi:hypothetical protein
LKIQDIDTAESPAEVLQHIARIASTGSETFETRHKSKDGEISDVSVKAKMITISGKEYMLCTWYPLSPPK